jgi:predicted RNA-binding protein with PUA-like domain
MAMVGPIEPADSGRWLFKEEPSHYSFDDLVRDGRAVWDGVENNLALKHLGNVRRGDEIIFYHTGKEKMVVGLMKAVSHAHPDPARDDARFVVVEVESTRRLHRSVTLSEIKRDRRFASFDLVRNSRLSVMPVPDRIWTAILKMSEP